MDLLNYLSKTLLISTCLIFSVQSAPGQSIGKESLSHLDGVLVSVSVSEEAQQEGLFKSNLKSNTELQLRKADISVYEEEDFTSDPATPALFISVSTFKDGGLFSYTVSTELRQTVYTVEGAPTNGVTYKVVESIGTVGASNVRNLADIVRQTVRTFINDWLSVHEQ